MFVVALCPTFRHSRLLQNSLALWKLQTYPSDRRHLIIFDDEDGAFNDIVTDEYTYLKVPRPATLPDKYHAMLQRALSMSPDAIVIWEDDDIYLPRYVEMHVNALRRNQYSKPEEIYTDCHPDSTFEHPLVNCEMGVGRFHSSQAFQTEFLLEIGAWPRTKRQDFDLQLISTATRAAKSMASPWGLVKEIQYVWCWHTGHAHGQWCMSSPSAEDWYDRAPRFYHPEPFVGDLVPVLHPRTLQIADQLGIRLRERSVLRVAGPPLRRTVEVTSSASAVGRAGAC